MVKHKKNTDPVVLTEDDKMLIVLRNELYEGSWTFMLKDLKSRVVKKPFVFKLYHRIQYDMRRIQKLMTYEKKYGIDVSEMLLK